jgi:phosphate acetyltransferase
MCFRTENAMDDNLLHNRTFAELQIGESATLVRTAGLDDIQLFAAMSGDVNPAHVDAAFASHDMFGHVVVQGMWTAGLISALLGTKLPGPGTIYLDQALQFRHPVVPGDVVSATVTVKEKRADKRIVILDTRCTNQRGEAVLIGVATVIAPAEPIVWPRVARPDVSVRRHDRYDAFIKEAQSLPALRTAIVHPCSVETIKAAIEARDKGMIDPVLIGPEAKIRAAAELAEVSLEGITIVAVEHSHAAAARAVEMGAAGKVAALMKGSLETDELLAAVVSATSGLRTGRRISHVYAMDVPAYPKPLFITDAAVNVTPTLEQKRDICQNAIDLLHLLGIEQPRVAVLAAVETVNPRMPTTLDAAALTVMALRGQIRGALVDGPLAFDNAISFAAAKTKGIVSAVAGQADILLTPDLEAGNMLAKQLVYFGGADAAGLVLGARLPIIMTSRADSLRVRLASVALARIVADRALHAVELPS